MIGIYAKRKTVVLSSTADAAQRAAIKVTAHPLSRKELAAMRVMTDWISYKCFILSEFIPYVTIPKGVKVSVARIYTPHS